MKPSEALRTFIRMERNQEETDVTAWSREQTLDFLLAFQSLSVSLRGINREFATAWKELLYNSESMDQAEILAKGQICASAAIQARQAMILFVTEHVHGPIPDALDGHILNTFRLIHPELRDNAKLEKILWTAGSNLRLP